MSKRAKLICVLFAASMSSASASDVVEPSGSGGDEALRVCADPNNMPFSNKSGEGFENKLAELVAGELGRTVEYTWWPERRGFLRNTLDIGACDVVMGIPPLDMLATTRAYYASSYVFVSRAADDLGIERLDDPKLKDVAIGVHLIGDDGANTPATHVLGAAGIVENIVGYPIYGDYREDSPPSKIVRDVASGAIDVAIVWGPLAGYYAQMSDVPLDVEPLSGTERYLPLVFQYPIGMGVRKTDVELKEKLDDVIAKKADAIDALLERYGVPGA